MNFFREYAPNPARRNPKKEILSFTATGFLSYFGKDVVIKPSEAAPAAIRTHPQCPFQTFQWAGEFTWYYDPLHVPTTQVLFWEK